jgi:U32 family peptidase
MVPLSVLGEMRRSLTRQLLNRLEQPPRRQVAERSVLDELRPRREEAIAPQPAQLHLLCRSLAQLQILLDTGVRDVSADFADIRQYRDAVAMARRQRVRLALATPRIFKPGEGGIFKSMLRCEPDAVLVRNLAGLQFFHEQGVPVIADYSLNVANELTAGWIQQAGVERLTVSYDLNRDQLLHLVAATPANRLEVVVHHHMPMFHMEHCVFCAVLSAGTNKTNCGRPCDEHVVHLEDRVGMRHLLTADVGCRNTLFNAQAQSAAEIIPELVASGIRWLRIELLDQSSTNAIQRTVTVYQQLLEGRIGGHDVWSELQATNRVGVTRGTLEARRDPLALL